MIEVLGLTKRFGENTAVRDLHFEVGAAEVVGLLGPNGAGKTTTMRMLTTFLEPDAGDARVAGHSIRTDPQSVRRNLGYLPEGPPLYPEMSIPAYLMHLGRLRSMRRPDRRRRMAEVLEQCDLRDVLDREIGQLSRGYRQRVGLAGTLLHEPAVLILDEPTTGLDPHQIVGIRQLVRRVAQERTVVLSSHILSEVEATCDRVLILAGGELRADGATETIAESGATAEGRASYRLAVKGRAERAEAELRAADFVAAVERIQGLGDRASFDVTVTGEDGDERLFRLAVEKGLVLTELRRLEVSLEKAFVDLTRKRGDAT